jgi:hypothetical protein
MLKNAPASGTFSAGALTVCSPTLKSPTPPDEWYADSRSSQDHRMAVGLILNEIWKYKMEVPGKMDAG